MFALFLDKFLTLTFMETLAEEFLKGKKYLEDTKIKGLKEIKLAFQFYKSILLAIYMVAYFLLEDKITVFKRRDCEVLQMYNISLKYKAIF